MSGFLLLCVGVIYLGLDSEKARRSEKYGKGIRIPEVSLFRGVYFYKAYEFKPSFILESNTLKITDNTYMDFETPKGIFYSKGVEYQYEGRTGFLNQKKEELELKGDVRLSGKNFDYVSDKISFVGPKSIFNAEGNVSSQIVDSKTLDLIKLKSEKLTSFIDKQITELTGNVRGSLKRKRIYEGGFRFSASKVTVNSLESQMNLSESVRIHRNNYYLRSGSAEIFMENYNKKLKYYSLYDDVKLEENLTLSSGEKQLRRAFAEKLEGVQSTGEVILTGAPRVEQGNDTIKGYQITLRENIELIEVDDAQSRFRVRKD